MKKSILTLSFFLAALIATACPVCEKQQPKLLRGITHGGGPNSQWDYLIVIITVIIVLFTLFYSVKWIFRPGEKSPNHIKHTILNAE